MPKGNDFWPSLDFKSDTMWIPREDKTVRAYARVVSGRRLVALAEGQAEPWVYKLLSDRRLFGMPEWPYIEKRMAEAGRRRLKAMKTHYEEILALMNSNRELRYYLVHESEEHEIYQLEARIYATSFLIDALVKWGETQWPT